MNKKIIEITTFKELFELSSSGAVQGYSLPIGNDEDEKKMKNEQSLTEQKLRSYIRAKITEIVNSQKTQQLNEEKQLRKLIRSIISEADVSDIHPHRSTGINVLEDLLKKMIPTVRTDYKRLTTSQDQKQV